MGWIRRKLDSLAGTVVAVIFGLTSLQLPAFIHAYVQRLGGHLDEARLGLAAINAGKIGPAAGESALREQLAATAQGRIDHLQATLAAIDQAASYERPFVFFARVDSDIALATAASFTPSLPLDVPSLIFAVVGILVGWIIWGIVKMPVRLFRRKDRRAA